MKPSYHPILLFFFISQLSFFACVGSSTNSTALFHVGVVLDLNSWVGKVAQSCISMAISDFYARHQDYNSKIVLHTRDSKGDVVSAASAALDLMKNVQVQAIIGPQRSAEAKFMIDLGKKAHVPIISFSATSPSLSPTHSPYFVRTTQDDSSQVQAIVAIVQAFGWGEVVPIYEDTEYGNGFIPYLIDGFQGIYTRVPYRSVIPPSANDFHIIRELKKLKGNQTRVLVVHMTASLGSRLFALAKEEGMMTKGYAWIITDGLSGMLDLMTPSTIDSMQGVLGIKPYIPRSKDLEDVEMRWKRELFLKDPNNKMNELNLFGIRAYDTTWALAMAVERVGPMNYRFLKSQTSENLTDLATLGTSEMGPRILKTILNTSFKGLSGEFHLVEGQLQSSAFQIFNVIGKGERVIGYWTPKKGLSQELDVAEKVAYSTSMADLKKPIWPGDSITIPKGWVISTKGNTLRIGVPMKKGFTEFVDVKWDSQTKKTTHIDGFSIAVFRGVLGKLPFGVTPHFIPYMKADGSSDGSYDNLVYEVHLQSFEAQLDNISA
ncbi:hypothetical protein HHK36_013700 [Tetracentron sinense]|uniref:Receptor ligand binding region domain-containing protein n=1 Tax=Tetracentron sinense TaxID=13715 RepID=A0A834ZDV8_TETSI|nr:hypothetical protein HHK36_013700 [Tetracentron sinense]